MRTIAWAYLAEKKGKEYLVTDFHGETEIYLKKPPAIRHPFDYGNKGWKWKPTKIIISKP